MATSYLPGHSRNVILEALPSGVSRSAAELGEIARISKGSAARHLADMESEGLVERSRLHGNKWVWSRALATSPAPETPHESPELAEPESESVRVKLVEELLEIERVLSEQYPMMLARRTEILELLK